MYNGRFPILFFREHDGDVLAFLPNTESVLNKLRVLAQEHTFEISHWRDITVIEQGDAWKKIKSESFKPRDWEKKSATLIGGNVGARKICDSCPHEWRDCGGLLYTSPGIQIVSHRANGIDMLREAALSEVVCPLYALGEVNTHQGSIKPRDIRALGFEPLSNIRAFYDEDFDEEDFSIARDIAVTGMKSLEVVEEIDSCWVQNQIEDPTWSKPKAAFTGLHFDKEQVLTSIVASKMKGLHNAGINKARKDYRKENCESCVFNCEYPPWRMDEENFKPKPVTREQILDEWRPNKDHLRWMSLFTICGQNGRFVSESSGRRRDGVGSRPELEKDELKIRVLSRRPGYEVIASMDPEEYWDEIKGDLYNRTWLPDGSALTCDDEEKLAITHWALKSLCDITFHNEARFTLPRSTRNDILYIRLWGNCSEIEIGSDTRATSWGGMRHRGSSISVDSRPRFKTNYSYPFAESIWDLFSETPGACAGRKRLR